MIDLRLRPQAFRAISLVTVLGLATALLLSASFKAAAPWPAANSVLRTMGWVGSMSLESGIVVTDVVSLVEALVGSSLLWGVSRRWALRAGALVSLMLLVVHGLMIWSSHEGCGCFGFVDVPEAVIITVLLGGLFGCCSRLKLVTPSRGRSLAYLGKSCFLAAVALAPGLTRPGMQISSEQWLVEHLVEHGWKDARVLIAAGNCEDCDNAVRSAMAEENDTPVCVVLREDDDGAARMRDFRVHVVSVPTGVWWDLIEAAPPRRLMLVDGRWMPWRD